MGEPPDVERDRTLFARIAATHPGIVRTLDLLVAELRDADLDPEVLRELGDRIGRIGARVTADAHRTVIDLRGTD